MGKSLCAAMHVGATLALVICMLSSSLHGASAQDCNTALTTLLPCFPYIQAGNTTNPGTDCCTPLGSLLTSTSTATCLCQVGATAQQLSVTVNQTRALEIAALCHQTVPSNVVSCLSSIAPTPSVLNPISGGPPTDNSTPSNNNDGSIVSPSSFLLGSILVVLSLYFNIPA